MRTTALIAAGVLALLLVARAAAAQPAAEPDPPATRRPIATVLVKDFMRLDNSGPEVTAVQFLRYFPKADDEQIPVARWVSAATDDGVPVGITVAAVHADPAANLVHTLALERAPAQTGVTVTITSLVLRREPPMPRGEFPIPPRQAYPPEVRPFLASTPMVNHRHRIVREHAARLREESGGDVLKLARGIVRLMNSKDASTPWSAERERLPTSAMVLKHGGSCCSSAVAAAALFRANGVPAQVTYTPAGYVHGVVQFYVLGHGWVRMDATCSAAQLPLVRDNAGRGLVRLFDTPIQMEQLENAYGWPYYHTTMNGPYAFWSDGTQVTHIRFASRPNPDDPDDPGWVHTPFRHLVPGSWNAVMGLSFAPVGEETWADLAAASRAAIQTDLAGGFADVIAQAAAAGLNIKLAELVQRAERYGPLETAR